MLRALCAPPPNPATGARQPMSELTAARASQKPDVTRLSPPATMRMARSDTLVRLVLAVDHSGRGLYRQGAHSTLFWGWSKRLVLCTKPTPDLMSSGV